MKFVWLLCLLAITTMADKAKGKRDKQKKNPPDVISHIMRNYDSRYRPDVGTDRATNVTLDLVVLDLVSVTEGTMEASIQFLVWLNIKWTDSRLSWNQKKFNNSYVRLSPQSIWTPDIMLYNSKDPRQEINWNTRAVVRPDGGVLVVVPTVLPVHCGRPKNPSANWECTLKFGSWTYNGADLNLQLGSATADTSEFNGRVWQITDNEAKRNALVYECCPEPYIDITYEFRLLRL